jgi:type II secretory pathway component GspD/PulD (secretin)
MAGEEGPAQPVAAAIARLLGEADAAAASGKLTQARDGYRAVLARDPGNAEARAALARIEAVIAAAPAPIASPQPDTTLHQQAALAEARMAIGRAELLSESGRNEDAAALLSAARVSLQPHAADATVRGEIQRIDGLLATARTRQTQEAGAADQARRQSARSAAEARTVADQVVARSRFQERLARVVELEHKQLYESALAACRRLLADYPNQPEADATFRRLIAATHEQRRLTIEEQKVELLQEVQERIERSLIPSGFDGWPEYPSDFAQRHTGQFQLQAPTKLEPWHEALLEKLATRMTYNFDAQNAVEVLNVLARQANINLVIDPAVLAAGDKLVTLKATNITLEHTLAWITRLIDSNWYITKGAVYVGGTAVSQPILGVYDVADLLNQGRDQAGKELAFTAGNAGGGGGGGGAGGLNPFKSAMMDAAPAVSPEDLVDLMQKAVSPATWMNPEYGISIRGTTLMVTAPPSTHLLIQQFIRSQSLLKNQLVRVEARWLTLSDNYLEEIGVNWSTTNGLLTLPGGQTDGYHRGYNQWDTTGALVNNLPSTATTISPATANTGLSLQATLLKATQLSAILTAVERNQRGTILESPTLTTISGVRSNCFFGHQYAYIGDYTVGAASGGLSATLDPEITTLNLGAMLDIRPYVSADGKYVTMEFKPAIATLEQIFLETIQMPRFYPIATDPVTGLVTGVTIVLPFPIELPTILVREVGTNVTIPDGGIMLVGGFGHFIDQEMSTKIPFLGHIPFVGRLFGQRGRYSERSKLFLLAEVHIINYSELEARL